MSEFEDYVSNERERLTAERNSLLERRAEIDADLAEIDRHFAAVDAYEAAKTGQSAKPVTNGAAPKASRAQRGSIRAAILNTVNDAPAGMSRGELLDVLGIKGDKVAEMSVSNALTAMVKNGSLVREGGRYRAPTGSVSV